MNIDIHAFDAQGNQVDLLELTVGSDLLASVYASNAKVLKLSIGGHENVASITIKYTIVSASGTYSVGEVNYTTPVAA